MWLAFDYGPVSVLALLRGSSAEKSTFSNSNSTRIEDTLYSDLTVPLPTQVYKWVPASLTHWVTLRWTSIPSRVGGGSRNTPNCSMLQKPE